MGSAEEVGGAGGANDPEAVAGTEGKMGGFVNEGVVALEGYDVGLVVAAHICGGKGLSDEWGAVRKHYACELEFVEVSGRVGRGGCLFGLDHGEDGGDLLVRADHTYGVPREDARLARGNDRQLRAALYGHDRYPVFVADIGIYKAFSYERASVAHMHVSQVEVAHKVVVLA